MYILNIEKIMKYALRDKSEKEREIVDIYNLPEDEENKTELSQKSVRELSNTYFSQTDTLRYEFLKSLIDTVVNGINESGVNMRLGDSLVFNSLLHDGFIIDVPDDEIEKKETNKED